MLDRIQRHVPPGVQVVIVTETEGHAGPDLLNPADEVAWLDTLYTTQRHLSCVVAIWAGEKQAQEPPLPPVALPGGDTVTVHFQRYLPTPSPANVAYQVITQQSDGVIVDGRGLIRSYHDLATREDEADIIRTLTSLRGQTTSSPQPTP
jgi:hypothetical protein